MGCDLPTVMQLVEGSAGLSLNGTCACDLGLHVSFAPGLVTSGPDLLWR